MKYALLLACLGFGTAYADGSYICQNYGGTINLGQRTLYSGGDVVLWQMKLNIKGNSVHIDANEFEVNCVHDPDSRCLLDAYLANAVDCKGTFRMKEDNETFEGLLTLSRALLEGAPQGQLYQMGNDVLLIYNCVQG